MKMAEIISHNIRRMRITQGLTQAELAQRLSEITGKDIDNNYISMLETMKRGMRYPRFQELCRALNCREVDLIRVPPEVHGHNEFNNLIRMVEQLAEGDVEILAKLVEILLQKEQLEKGATKLLIQTIEAVHREIPDKTAK